MLRRSPLKRTGLRSVKRVPGTARKTLRAGKKTKEWNRVRAQVKREFAAQGITTCELKYEGCRNGDWLSIAHGRKRRKLQGNELKTLTILACVPCHERIEFLAPEEMLAIVNSTIERRINRA